MTNEISPSMNASPYAEDLGITLLPGEAGVGVALPFEERNTMLGVFHGGALASLVPISAFAEIQRAAPDAADLRTLSLHMEYARAARKPVVAQTRAVRQVRELAFFETQITDCDGDVVAFASSAVSHGVARSAEAAAPARAPLDSASPEVAGAIQEAIAASPYLSRRGVRLAGSAAGAVELALAAAPVNLDRAGRVHEGAAITLIDAAGATCPWTLVPVAAGAWGATIALHVQVLGPLPTADLVARAFVRARNGRVSWVDVTVVSAATAAVHALGTVVYRFNEAAA
jgi:uncharacterized protein (TIGR00369 family)